MLGCGALGSKVSMNLARMGYTEQHFYDEDVILPHNLVRHYESGNYAVGHPKAEVMKIEMDCMFNDNNSTSHTENIFNTDILPEGIVIDCTASRRILFWATLTDKIKSSMIRSEIYLGGKMGLTIIEGKKIKVEYSTAKPMQIDGETVTNVKCYVACAEEGIKNAF